MPVVLFIGICVVAAITVVLAIRATLIHGTDRQKAMEPERYGIFLPLAMLVAVGCLAVIVFRPSAVQTDLPLLVLAAILWTAVAIYLYRFYCVASKPYKTLKRHQFTITPPRER